MSNATRESRPVLTYRVKLHNARVDGGLMADGTIVWRFKRLNEQRCIEGKNIRLSSDAMAAMFAIVGKFQKTTKEGTQ